jgi:hypothetical protein
MKRLIGAVLGLALCVPMFVASAQAPTHARTATVNAISYLQPDQGNPDVKVWVNTDSGVYHCPGTRWYGATKQGRYLKQSEAQKKGFRPAYGRVCR